jgi:Carboxypeptidase regulatory-like domain
MLVRHDVPAVFLLLILTVFLAAPGVAQLDRGAIIGVVTDQAGARVADAQITITNIGANQPTTVATSEDGAFAVNLLRIGTYSVTAEKKGFQKTIQQNVEVGVNESVRVELVLKVGSTGETIEVNSAPPQLETESSSLGTIETERRISELPLNGRNFIQLAYLGPGANGGVTGSNVSGGVFENERANEAISVNGLRVSNNNFLLNGVDNNEFGLGGTIALPPPDAIQEFRTEENGMSAEFGRGGAAVNVVTKSGANHLHGGAYEYIRNDKLDARNYFSQDKTPFKRNQFGVFLGGPIRKDRTFLFGDYEASRLRESTPFLSTVPTAEQRNGDFHSILGGQATDSGGNLIFDVLGRPVFVNEIYDPTTTRIVDGGIVRDGFGFDPVTGLPIPGQANIIPQSAIDTVGQNIVRFYPQPTTTDTSNNYLANQKHLNDQNSFDVRLDQRFREQDQVFAAYSLADIKSARPGPLGDAGGSDCCPSRSRVRSQHLGLGYTHTFTAQLLNDLHGGYFRYAVNALPFNFGKNVGTDVLGIPNANRGDPNSSGLTNIDVAGVASLGDSEFLPEHAFENIFQLADTLTWIRGKHSLKLGVDFRRQQRNFYQVTAPRGLFVFGGNYTSDLNSGTQGSGVADTLLGYPQQTEQDFLSGLYPTRYWDVSEFVQDDWHLRKNLTLNIGLRYELTAPANGRVGNFDLQRAIVVTSYGPGAVPHAGVKFDKSNWAPRVGFAWSLPRNTVLHGAAGIFHAAEANIFDDLGLNPPQLAFYAKTYNPGALPKPEQKVSNGFPDTLPTGDALHISGPVKTTGSKRIIPTIYEWNVSVQHQFGQNWVVQAGYVGTRANHLWNHEASDLNQPMQNLDTNFCGSVDETGACTQPNFGRRYFTVQPDLTAVLPLDYAQLHMFYNSFQTSLNRRFANGFNVLAAYTFAKNVGNADGNVGGAIQDSYHANLEHGPVSPDIRHRLSMSYIYELPFGRGRRFLGTMGRLAETGFGGWQVSGITAIQSGEAVTAALSSDVTNTGSFSPRPDQIHNPADFSYMPDPAAFTNVYGCTPGKQTLQCWYNPEAFSIPALAPGQNSAHLFGNSRIGNLRGPDLVNFDFVLQKNFKLYEAHQLEFRAEFFNIFNHPNFGLPGANPDVPGGNSVTSTSTDNRQVEFALKYTF